MLLQSAAIHPTGAAATGGFPGRRNYERARRTQASSPNDSPKRSGSDWRAACDRRFAPDAGSYVTQNFGLAASYALRQPNPAIVIVDAQVRLPDEIAYLGEEFQTVGISQGLQVLRPKFDSTELAEVADLPADWWEELADNLGSYRYPHLFSLSNWEVLT
jgi:hypothetical protein